MKEITVKGIVNELYIKEEYVQLFAYNQQFSKALTKLSGRILNTQGFRVTDVHMYKEYFIGFDMLPDELFLRVDAINKRDNSRNYQFSLRSIGNKISNNQANWILAAIIDMFVHDGEADYLNLKEKLLIDERVDRKSLFLTVL